LAQDAEGWQITTDTLFYSDSDNVIVVSPQVSVHRSTDEDGGSVGARVIVDAVSAASVDVVSQATKRFSETRSEVDLSLSKNIGSLLPSVTYTYSHEPDYDSQGFGIAVQRELGSADTIASLGYNLSIDTVGYTGTDRSSFSESLWSHGAALSVTQVINPKMLVRGIYTLSLQQGYLEKPYRFVPLFDQAGIDAAQRDGAKLDLSTFDKYRLSARTTEEVPFRRVGHAVGTRTLYYLESLPGALHLDYQFFFDSWGVRAHTFEPAIHWKVSESLTAVGYARLYLQQAASFWQREYVVGQGEVPKYRTMDRDLSDYAAYTAGGRLNWQWDKLASYVDIGAMDTVYSNYIFLQSRFALIVQAGARLQF